MTTKATVLTLPKEELVYPGNRACVGCGLGIAYRMALKALGPDTILVVPPSCLTVLQGLFPVASTKLPSLNVTFASTAAAATGILEALKAQGREHIKVCAWAGDGGTSDIGLQALSGAAERGNDFVFICYDNEGYMNTGVQRSGTTPWGAVTTNTPFKGKQQQPKDVPTIMAAQGIDYVATTSASYPLDVYNKVKKAISIKGTKYIHIHTPCPPGWGFEPRYTVKVGRLAVQSGYFDLYEVERGVLRLTGASAKLAEKRQFVPVCEYLRSQSRFRLLGEEQIAEVQARVDAKWSRYYQQSE
jgi:pyruvate ferredoxin oxidoreductase beta subunit